MRYCTFSSKNTFGDIAQIEFVNFTVLCSNYEVLRITQKWENEKIHIFSHIPRNI